MGFFDDDVVDVEGLSDEALEDLVGGSGLAHLC